METHQDQEEQAPELQLIQVVPVVHMVMQVALILVQDKVITLHHAVVVVAPGRQVVMVLQIAQAVPAEQAN
jgi:hypothetical protein